MKIGELAERTHVSADTIRHYEKLGLLPQPARTQSGYRQYTESAVNQVRLVQNALQFGFSLKQVGVFLQLRRNGGTPCQNVRAAGAEILEALERQIRDLTALRESIQQTLIQWDQRLAQTPDGRPAHLLDHLPTDTNRRRSWSQNVQEKRTSGLLPL